MSVEELLKYILDQSGFLPPTFAHWVESSSRFQGFVDKYKDKISAKFSEAESDPEPEEKLKDTLFELEIAYVALRATTFSVEYESHSSGPDFTFTDENGVVFNIETKRIRRAREEKRLQAWIAEVAAEVRAVPSALAVAVHVGTYVDELSALLHLLDRLESRKLDVIQWVVNTIQAQENSISPDGAGSYPVPGFEGQVDLELRKPSSKPSSNHTSFNGGARPLFFVGQEWKQFKDLIFPDKRDQTIPGMINVLAINTDSATHDTYALVTEIKEDFEKRVAQANVTKRMKNLSGILFRGAYKGFLWPNPVASCPIPTTASQALQKLTCYWLTKEDLSTNVAT